MGPNLSALTLCARTVMGVLRDGCRLPGGPPSGADACARLDWCRLGRLLYFQLMIKWFIRLGEKEGTVLCRLNTVLCKATKDRLKR